jgi:C1A family cysteine protease
MSRKYGWLPDLPDYRDHRYAAPVERLQALPSQIDLRSGCPPVYDQGQLGSCTANAIAAALQFDELKQKEVSPFEPSRLFIYYCERDMEGTTSSDSGAMIRDGIKSVASTGYCPETEWPYDITKFADQPSVACYQDAKKYKAIKYQRVIQSLTQMKGCLAAGTPFVAGFSVYESIQNESVEQTGDIPLPQQGEATLGGHAILIVGYDDARQVFSLRNSWGEGWGDGGYGTLPYAYLTSPDLASDFWVVETVS